MQLVKAASVEDEQQLSPSIYAALVDSLFQNPAPMFAGALTAGIAAVLTAIKTSNEFLWPCAAVLIVIGAARSLDMRNYKLRDVALTPEEASRWEVRYQIGAMIYAAALGLWCCVTLIGSDDAVAHMICTSVTLGYIAAGAGRAYGRPWIFHLQILFACGPLSVALAMRGTPYYIGLALLLAFFFVGLKHITTSLQQIFVRALLAREREAALASQFDTALNNMPNGLCMFGADGRLAVINHRFTEMMGLSADLMQRGLNAREMVSSCVSAGTVSAASGMTIVSEVESLRTAEITTLDYACDTERALSWRFQPMVGGGTVVLVEDITQRRKSEALISHMARFDELTGLPNRVSFRNEIGRMMKGANRSTVSALLFVDLDQFKQVNDTLGHPCGDQLLCMVADRMRGLLRPDDFIARFGGDEFVVFQSAVESNHDAADLARRIVECLSERYDVDNHQVEIGASVGIAMTELGVSADILLRNADMALYRAKASGRGTFCFFREEMAQTVEARRVLELDLRRALANEEFELFYQPLVNLKSGRIVTCEALLRWNHPERGQVSPIDIIPVAEDMGLIIDLGRWILRKACVECMRWPDAVSVAVNFSSQQFHQRDVLSEVRHALELSGLPAHRLEIEITESSLLRDTQSTHDALSQLNAAGVSISLDDFGTGFSSLSYLHTFPLHKVKIDRSFLEGIDNDRPLTLLRGVARLSADLGMGVVVEGIETNEQLELISADGTVTEAQGYLFSRPVPATRVRHLLELSHGRDKTLWDPLSVTARNIA
ncbi:EAL domain-containing protein [soil metagenome]